MDFIETEGKTVEEAIEKACQELNLPEEKLNIDILSAAASGLLSFMGMRKAKIKASVKEVKEDNKLELAKKTLEEILLKLNINATIDGKDMGEKILLNMNGDGSGLLIGRRGRTLDALQHIVGKIVNRSSQTRKPVILDSEGYREKRTESLKKLALRLGQKAKKFKKPVSINPLNAHDRRIIHMALQNDEELTTTSKGDGLLRRMVISMKKSKSAHSSSLKNE